MRLQGCVDGRLYGTVGRTLFVEREDDRGSFQRQGTIPGRTSGRSQLKEVLLDSDDTRGVLERIVGYFSVATVQGVSRKSYVATAGRKLSISHDGGNRWQHKRTLPESSPPFGALPSAIEVTDKRIFVGEYPLTSDQSPGVLVSDNGGETWQRIPISDVRHIHSVQKDPYSDEVWITTGDTDDECWIGRLREGRFEPIGGGSQQWRAVELAFTPDAILWGMDCSYADQNRVFRLDRETLAPESISKRPRTVHTVDGSVFYSASVERGEDRWIAFSTAAEPSTDSTAPERSVRGSESAGVVISSSVSDFTDWQELRRYSRRQVVGDRIPGNVVPKASAYVYLAADDERGLFLNPYNTSRSSGSIERIPIDQLPK